jgi:hypothetical protein
MALLYEIIKIIKMPMERYFNPEPGGAESEQRKRVSFKLKRCPEHYLPIIEGALDGVNQITNEETDNE